MTEWNCKDCNQGLMGTDWCTKCWELEKEKHLEEIKRGPEFMCCDINKCIICRNNKIKKKNNKKKFSALWYSVSPPRGDPYKMTDGLSFIKKMEKFFHSVSIEKAVWAFEWKYKGGPLEYYGIHCHCLLFGSQKKLNWHIQRQKEKYFNLNPEQRFVIYEGDEELIKDKINYFTGETFDDNKNTEKEWDKLTREKHSIKNIYFKNCDLVTFGISSSNIPKEAKNVVEFN